MLIAMLSVVGIVACVSLMVFSRVLPRWGVWCARGAAVVFLVYFIILGIDLVSYRATSVTFLPVHRSVFTLLYPPADYWTPLATCPIHQDSSNYRLCFKNKYPGAHAVVIHVPKQDVVIGQCEDFRLHVRTMARSLDGTILTVVESDLRQQTWVMTGIEATCMNYTVPGQLPLGQDIVIELDIGGDIPNFLTKYPHSAITIKKTSDE